MQAEYKHKKIIFILPFLLLFFCGLQDYTYSALCFFILSLHVLKFKFAYSIFYIKPRKISVIKCIDIALNSCAVLSFFVIDRMEASLSRMATNRSNFNFIQYSTSWYILIVY